MAAAYYRVTLPTGESYVHGGNKSEIRCSTAVLQRRAFPAGTKIVFHWGDARRVKCIVTFKSHGRGEES